MGAGLLSSWNCFINLPRPLIGHRSQAELIQESLDLILFVTAYYYDCNILKTLFRHRQFIKLMLEIFSGASSLAFKDI